MAELFTIVWCHNTEMLAKRIAQKANLNVQDGLGDTLLIKSIMRGFDDMAQLLIDAGCRLDTQNMRGDTALIVAAKYQNEKMVRVLAKAGADIDICNEHLQTVNDFVREEETIRLLEQIRNSEKGRPVRELKELVCNGPATKIMKQFETKEFLTSLRLYGLFAEAFQQLNVEEIEKTNDTIKGKITRREQLSIDKVRWAKLKAEKSHF